MYEFAVSVGSGVSDVAPPCTSRAVVKRTDRLCVPHRKRMSHAYVTSESGVRELCLYYGDKEVTFDEQRLFAFGEQLVNQPSFIAEDATAWGPGYDWEEIRELLETLVEEGIVKRGDAADDPRGGGLVPSQLPPSQCPVPRMWSAAECESITLDLGGRALEIGNLEAVVQSYRIAHPALDSDGRQVGEANVFPPGLRLDRDTEWRVCHYAGSRYRDDAPMNVTALKAMIKHWKPMMATLLAVRAEAVARLQRSRAGWTIGDLHTFSRIVLALPAYLLMKRGRASPSQSSGPVALHPVLSSLYRIVDGIRMTTHDMLFLSHERTRSPEEPITGAEIYRFAEHQGLFLSDHGVCAGPQALIDELFAVVFSPFDAERPGETALPAEIHALLAELPAAVDYALLGLQVWGVSRSVWLAMSRAYRILRGVLGPATGEIAGRLRTRLAEDWQLLERERIAVESEAEVHRVVYADAYEQSWRGLAAPGGSPSHADRIAPRPMGAEHRVLAAQLRDIMTDRLVGSGLAAAEVDRVVEVVVDYVRAEQGILASTAEIQDAINALLDRPRPTRPLAALDLRMLFTMHGGSKSWFPYLFDTLEDELGFRVACTADSVAVETAVTAAKDDREQCSRSQVSRRPSAGEQ